MRKKYEFCDVTFVFENEEVKAHKLILAARSEEFKKLFEPEMSNRRDARIDINDVELSVFKIMVEFIYSCKLDIFDFKLLKMVLQAAHSYGIKSLVDLCAYRLSTFLTILNVLEILVVADRINENSLKNDCIQFISFHSGETLDSGEFQQIKENNKDLAIEVLEYTLRNKPCSCNSNK